MKSFQEIEKELTEKLGYQFKNPNLLQQALTRGSALNERVRIRSTETFQRLEYLGDSVLGTAIADILFEHYPHDHEGTLTIMRSRFVNNHGPLYEVAKKFDLGKFLIMGYGEDVNGSRENTKILFDAMEALIGAIWLDTNRNFKFLRGFVLEHWTPLGLLPSAEYNEICSVLTEYELDLNERVKKLKICFKKHITQATLDQILDHIYDVEKEILEIVLSKKPNQEFLDGPLCIAMAFG